MNDSWHSKEGIRVDVFGLYSISIPQFNVSRSWRLAASLFNYFSNLENGYSDGVVTVNRDNLSTVVSDFDVKVGDIMFFTDKKGNINHSTIITKIKDGKIFYSAHTNSRFDKLLSSGVIGSRNFFIVKIKDDVE